MKRQPVRNKKVIARRKKAKKIKLVFFLALTLATVVGVFWFLHQPYARVQEYEITGQHLLQQSDILKVIDIHTAGYYGFFLVPKNSLFFYPRKKIEQSLEQTYSEIKNIGISKHVIHQSIVVQIKEHQPKYQYCTRGGCYLLNNQAVVFSRLSATDDLKIIKTHNKEYKINEQIVKPVYFNALNQLRDGLESKGILVSHVTFDEFANGFVYLKDGGVVLVLPEENYDQVFTRFNYLLTTEVFSTNKKTGQLVPKVAYINFRHGNKVFYCLEQENECKENYAEYR